MALPTGWPPRPASGLRSIRVYITGTATASYADNAYLFSQVTSANPFTPTPYVPPGGADPSAPGTKLVQSPLGDLTASGSPMGGGQDVHDVNRSAPLAQQAVPTTMIWSMGIFIANDSGSALFYSFDGTNDHGQLKAGETRIFNRRHEAGIAIKGSGVFRLEAW